jgi:hypothetical protein
MLSLSLIWRYPPSEASRRKKTCWRFVLLLCSFLAGGCFYIGRNQATDVLQTPVAKWSSRDCLTVMLSAMQNNIFDQRSPNIKIIATPYTPAVIAAISRMSQMKGHWADDETQHQIDTSLFLQAGLFFDWQTNQLMDSHGNYMGSHGRLDRLQFLVTLRNNSWPCVAPLQTFYVGGDAKYIMLPIAPLGVWPCYLPDITDLDQRIVLTNDRGLSVKPRFVFGRRANQLTMEETLVVSFDLHSGEHHLFDQAENIDLVLEGFDAPIKLTFRIADILRVPGSQIRTTAQD